MSTRFFDAHSVMARLVGTAAAATLAVLCACSSSDNPAAATSSYNAKARKALSAKVGSRDDDVKNMVGAVSATKNGAPVELRFALGQRPEVGQPLDLAVALVPHAVGLERVAVTFSGSDGLDVVEGAQTGSTEKPLDGAPVRYSVKLLPKQDGIFAVTAVVSVLSSTQTVTRSFSIPVIAGTGLQELGTKTESVKGS